MLLVIVHAISNSLLLSSLNVISFLGERPDEDVLQAEAGLEAAPHYPEFLGVFVVSPPRG